MFWLVCIGVVSGAASTIPVITSISPNNVPVGQVVSVAGSDFGSTKGKLTLGGTAITTSSWSNNSISFQVPATAKTGANPVTVTTSAGSSSPVNLNVVFAPKITSISPEIGLPRTEVTVTGTGFGASTPGTVSFNGVAGQIISWSDTQIKVKAPDGAAGRGPVVVSWQGVNSNGIVFNYIPSLFYLSQSTVGQDWGSFAIVGQNFLPSAGTVTLNGVPVPIYSWSNNSISLPVPKNNCSGPIVVKTIYGVSNSAILTITGTTPGCIQPLTIQPSISPAPNAAGWNNSSVTVSYSCKGGVAPVQCPAARQVTTDGAGQIITATASDAAGNSVTAKSTLNIDKTVPAITASATSGGAPYIAGQWSKLPVTVSFTCTDPISGVKVSPPPVTVSSDGAAQSATGSCTDNAGNTASTSFAGINIDTTTPTITATATANNTPYASGQWTNQSVLVTFQCTDSGSGKDVVSAPVTLTADGANQSATGTCTDKAGNAANATFSGINIDRAPPVITASATAGGSPYLSGQWSNKPVTVTFACTDSLSGTNAITPPATISNDGADQPVSGTCTDNAGNTASTTFTVSLDLIKPVVRITSPVAGTYLAGPTAQVSGTVTDATVTGVLVNDIPALLTGDSFTAQVPVNEGPFTIKASALDAAGNEGIAEVLVNIDSVPPVIVISAPIDGLITNASSVQIAGTVTDTSATNLIVDGQSVPVTSGAFSFTKVLPVEGPVAFVFAATDAAGNRGGQTLRLTVDHTPPELTVATPEPGAVMGTNPIIFQGLVHDATTTTVTVNGAEASRTQDAWQLNVNAALEGAQSFTVVARDAAGNETTLTRDTLLDTAAPTLTINSPSSGLLTREPSITVQGTATDISLKSVTINGASVALQPSGAGSFNFTSTVSLHDGDNNVAVVATDALGRSTNAQVLVTQDAIPPVVTMSAPDLITRSRSGQVDVTVTDNVAVSETVVKVNGTPIGTFSGQTFSVKLEVPATAATGDTLTVTAEAMDTAGNLGSAGRQVKVAADGVVIGQVLSDVTGLPLKGATVRVVGSEDKVVETDERGRYSLPVDDAHVVILIQGNSADPLMTSVQREVDVENGVGTVPVDARLTPIATDVSFDEGGTTVKSGVVSLAVPAAALSAGTKINLTSLSRQGLPGLLPLGWSPLTAFDVRSASELASPATAGISGLPAGAQVHLASYRQTTHSWFMLTPNLTTTSDGKLDVNVSKTGTYAIVKEDTNDPPIALPAADQVLTALNVVALPETATSTGSSNPSSLPPTGGTAQASLSVQSPIVLPSGTVVQAEVTEKFNLASGAVASEEKRIEDVLLYRTPAQEGSALTGEFPVTPSRTFTTSEIVDGKVHLDILAGRESVRGKTGGNIAVSVQSGDATLAIGNGALPQDTAVSIRSVSLSDFLPISSAASAIAEVIVDFSGQSLRTTADLFVASPGLNAGETVVVARVERINGIPHLFAAALAVAQGDKLVSQSYPGLPGIREGGHYVFYRISAPLGFIGGTITSASTGPIRAHVKTDGLPFMAASAGDGNYLIPALAGNVHLSAEVPNSSLIASAITDVAPGEKATQDLVLQGMTNLATVSPADGALAVDRSTQILISSPTPLKPASVNADNLKLYKGTIAPENVVPVRFVLSGSGLNLSLIPQTRFDAATKYTLDLATLTDTNDGVVAVPSTTFTTKAEVAPAYDFSKLVFSFPDENGIVHISAPSGTFPPGTRVLIVDAGNGVVLSLTAANDGSLTGEIPATIDDRMLITISDPNGTVTNIERSQFVAPDGRTAIGPGGGTVQGPGGVELRIPEGALDRAVVLQIDSFGPDLFPERPELPNAHFGSGLKITSSDVPTFNKEIKLAFPVPAELTPEQAKNAFFYVYRKLDGPDGKVVFETLDHAFVEGEGDEAKIVTASRPFSGYSTSVNNFRLLSMGGAATTMLLVGDGGGMVNYEICMWTYEMLRPGVPLSGVVTGKVRRAINPGTEGNNTNEVVYKGIKGATVTAVDSNGNSLGPVAVSHDDDGAFTFFDPHFDGGTVSIRATLGSGETAVATAYEVTVLDDKSIDYFAGPLFKYYRNVAYATVNFPPTKPSPPPPQVGIFVFQLDANQKRVEASVVPANAPLRIAFKSDVPITSASISGTQYAVMADRPDNPNDPNKLNWELTEKFVPGKPGMYTITATAVKVFGDPISVSKSFLAVAEGGNNSTTLLRQPPTVISTNPRDGADGVPSNAFPSIVFSEPVKNIPGSVTLVDSKGLASELRLSGINAAGQAVTDFGPSEAITTLTLQPVAGLKFNEQYTLTLSSSIVDLDKVKDPSLEENALIAAPVRFHTVGPEAFPTSLPNSAWTRAVVVKDRAYMARRVNLMMSQMDTYDISDPSSPVLVSNGTNGFIGIPTDVAAEERSTVIDGKDLVAVAAGANANSDYPIPSNLWLYDVSSPIPTRVGAVSATGSAVDEGFVLRVALKGGYAYTSTYQQGIQVIDLKRVVDNYRNTDSTQFATQITGDGVGFSRDAVVNVIPVYDEQSRKETLWDIAAGDFVLPGADPQKPIYQRLVLATGTKVPLAVVDPQSTVSLWQGQVQGPHDTKLQTGVRLVLGRLTDSLLNLSGERVEKDVVVIAGTGIGVDPNSITGLSAGPVLAVVDLSDPHLPYVLSIVRIETSATSLVLRGSLALIGTSDDKVLMINLADPRNPVNAGSLQVSGGRQIALTSKGMLLGTYGSLRAAVFETIAYVAKFDPNPIVLVKPPRPDANRPLIMQLGADVTLFARIVPGNSGITSASVLVSDDTGKVVAQLPVPIVGDQGSAIWARGSEVDPTRKYYGSVLAFKDGNAVSTFPKRLVFPSATIQVTRVDLTTTSSIGTPPPGSTPAFTYNAKPLSGANTAEYSTKNANANPNTADITAPANRIGVPTPGGLAELKVSYRSSEGAEASKTFQVATFGLSCYMVASEADHGDAANGTCNTMRMHGQVYQGTITNPRGLPPGTYCTSFLVDTRLQGSGQLADGTKMKFTSSRRSGNPADWQFSLSDWMTSDGTVVQVGAIATDTTIIPSGTDVELSTGAFTAHDTGGAIRGYRIDVFGGIGRRACNAYRNQISIGACKPGRASCPEKEIK